MTELNNLLKALILEELSPEERYYYENETEENKEIFMTNKKYFYDKKLKTEALRKVLLRKYESYIIDLIENEDEAELLPTLQKLREKEIKNDDKINSDFVFITISPVNTVDYIELIQYAEKFVKLKFIVNYCYVLEQRFSGVPDERHKKLGDGMHMHFFIQKSDYKPSHVRRDVKRIFAKIKCNIDVSFRYERDIDKTFNYILGSKKDEEKQKKQEQDVIWRLENKIKPFYGKDWRPQGIKGEVIT